MPCYELHRLSQTRIVVDRHEKIRGTIIPEKKFRGRTESGAPNPVDIHVGLKLRQRRSLAGLSQEKLARAVGVAFQQIQKYERGDNRMGASRLFEMAEILGVPVSYFFEGLAGRPSDPQPSDAEAMSRRETLELIRAYYAIKDKDVRRRVLELTKSLAAPIPA